MSKDNMIMWVGDNEADLREFLSPIDIVVERSGDSILLSDKESGFEQEIKPGDQLLIDVDREGGKIGLGILRVPEQHRKPKDDTKRQVNCSECGKPVVMYESVLQQADTLAIVCSQECGRTWEHRMRNVLANPPAGGH